MAVIKVHIRDPEILAFIQIEPMPGDYTEFPENSLEYLGVEILEVINTAGAIIDRTDNDLFPDRIEDWIKVITRSDGVALSQWLSSLKGVTRAYVVG